MMVCRTNSISLIDDECDEDNDDDDDDDEDDGSTWVSEGTL